MSLGLILGWLLVPVAALHAALATVLLVQIVASAMPRRSPTARPTALRPRLAVLVPAHDEQSTIAGTLQALLLQLEHGDRLVVVADNCSDATAAIARAQGAEVVVRDDPLLRGKGYALDAGIRYLEDPSRSPPEVLVIIDADCHLHPGGLSMLAQTCTASGRPTQALDLMQSAPAAGLRTRLGELAWIVRNEARPLGCLRLGWPCQLMGTGMAFPWPLIRGAALATGHLVEDLQLGIDLARSGAYPLFCPQALVTSQFPSSEEALRHQRMRWEHGHVGMLLSRAPPLLGEGLRRRDPALIAMALDLCIPPLALFVLTLGLAILASLAVWLLGGGGAALALGLAGGAGLVVSVLLAWWVHGRHVVSWSELLTVPLYVLAKLPIYAALLVRRKTAWIRTRRDDDGA